MFKLLILFVSYTLLTFGGVLPHSWYFLGITWLLAFAVYVTFGCIKRHRLEARDLLLFAIPASLFFVHPRLSVALCAFAWAAVAASDEKKTMQFLRALLVIGLLEAFLGLVQFFVTPGWIFGYTNPFNTSSGTLINRNHYAGLLEMLAPIGIGFGYIALRRYRQPARSYFFLFATAVMGVALCFSLSRTGIFTFFLTILFVVILLRMREMKQRFALGLGLGLFIMVIAGITWIGVDVIVDRYARLFEKDFVVQEGRMMIFRNTLQMIADNPAGVGIGRYQDTFRQYQTFRPNLLFDHAHNDYLETTAEWGIPMAALFWSSVLFVFFRGIRGFLGDGSPESRGILLASTGAIFAILVHSLTDFNLQIPSNAMIFSSFLGIVFAYSSPLAKFSEHLQK